MTTKRFELSNDTATIEDNLTCKEYFTNREIITVMNNLNDENQKLKDELAYYHKTYHGEDLSKTVFLERLNFKEKVTSLLKEKYTDSKTKMDDTVSEFEYICDLAYILGVELE